jgi:cysteine desulfurase family protein
MSIDTARVIFNVRDAAAELFGCSDPLRIAFTSNATSALNAAIRGTLKPGDHAITSSMEHNSVMRPLRALEADGLELTVLPCFSDGTIDPAEIKRAVKKNTKAVVVTHASNVTGTVMPIAEISRISAAHEIKIIVDGAQSAGVLPVDVIKCGIDLFAFTGHKGLYGPQGTGGLYIKEGLESETAAFIAGGTGSRSEKEEQPEFMPDKFEAGTPNSPGIAGLGAGIGFINATGMERIYEHESALTLKFLQGLSDIKGVVFYGPPAGPARTSVVSINIKGISASEVSQRLDEEFNIMTRPGLHCSPAAHRTMGTFPGGTVRFSIGYFNTDAHIAEALRAVQIISGGTQ